ncbi:MAG: DMT family transporter [Alphaproteobacteria bacterium]
MVLHQKRRNLAIICMILSACCFSAMNAFLKILSGYDPFVLIFFRQAVGLCLILVLLPFALKILSRQKKAWRFKVSSWRLNILRAATSVLAIWVTVLSLRHIGLAEMRAISMIDALILYVPALLFLKEKFDRQKFFMTFLGFVGTLFIFNPDMFSLWNLGCVYAIGAAFFYALNAVIACKIFEKDDQLSHIILWTFLVMLFAGTVAFAQGITLEIWQQVASEWRVFILLSFFMIAAQFLLITALKLGEATTVYPFGYIGLPLSILLGLFLFHEMPTVHAWIGMGIIMLSSLGLLRGVQKR